MVWHCHFGLHSQVLLFKSHLTGSARLLSKIALPLLDRWIPSVSNRFIESPVIVKIKTLKLTPATEPGTDKHRASISSFLLFSKWKIKEKNLGTSIFHFNSQGFIPFVQCHPCPEVIVTLLYSPTVVSSIHCHIRCRRTAKVIYQKSRITFLNFEIK